jgi:hypothetical protein
MGDYANYLPLKHGFGDGPYPFYEVVVPNWPSTPDKFNIVIRGEAVVIRHVYGAWGDLLQEIVIPLADPDGVRQVRNWLDRHVLPRRPYLQEALRKLEDNEREGQETS